MERLKTPNTREKLIELLDEVQHYGTAVDSGLNYIYNSEIADYLIANGVTVQEWIPGEDYYVLRNTETGMYFRGKGVNRWGKHFNQATIYRVKGTAEHNTFPCR